jgi:hypothetical protein
MCGIPIHIRAEDKARLRGKLIDFENNAIAVRDHVK